jgi:hypothetical protein
MRRENTATMRPREAVVIKRMFAADGDTDAGHIIGEWPVRSSRP